MREPEAVTSARYGLGIRLAPTGAAGLTQMELASLTAFSRSTIANVETGRQRVPRASGKASTPATQASLGQTQLAS